MVQTSQLQAILASATADALLDPAGWQEVLSAVSKSLPGTGAVMGVVDLETETLVHASIVGFKREVGDVWRSYRTQVQAADRHLAALKRLPDGVLYTETDYLDERRNEDREFLAWLDGFLGVNHQLSFSVREGRYAASLGLHRSRSLGNFGQEERAVMSAARDALQRPLRQFLQHSLRVADAYWSGLVGDSTRRIGLLDEHGLIVRASTPFEAVVGEGGSLRRDANRLIGTTPESNKAWRAALARVASGGSTYAAAFRLANGNDSSIMKLRPLPVERRCVLFTRAVALATIVVDERFGSTAVLLRDAFQLTLQESKIAAMLRDGLDLDYIAAALSVSKETARVHLKQIFMKTGTHRQAELVRLLTIVSVT